MRFNGTTFVYEMLPAVVEIDTRIQMTKEPIPTGVIPDRFDTFPDRLPFADSLDFEHDAGEHDLKGIGLRRNFVAHSHMSEHVHPSEKAIARMGRAKTSSRRQDHRIR